MKHFYFLLVLFMLFSIKSNLLAQESSNTLAEESNEYFKKGTSQIGLENLGFSIESSHVFGAIGLRYGYFIADNNLLFANVNLGFFDDIFQTYKFGLNYRRYFTSNLVKPFAQAGVHYQIEKYSTYSGLNGYNSTFWEGTLGGGAAIQVKRFGFELGLQLSIKKQVTLAPIVGLTFSF